MCRSPVEMALLVVAMISSADRSSRNGWRFTARRSGRCGAARTAGAASASSTGRLARRLRHPHRPAHDPVLELLVLDLVLAGADPTAHGNPGGVHGLGIAGDQRMPPVKVAAVGQQAVGAGR